MLKQVSVKNGEHYYNIPMHTYTRDWLQHLDVIPIPKSTGKKERVINERHDRDR